MNVYPEEAGEKHFVLKRICNFDPFDINPQAERFYSTEYFHIVGWIVKRKVIFEKTKSAFLVDPVTGEINLKYDPFDIQEDFFIPQR